MLDQEGLVVRERNRGARVRAITDAEALEIAETRLAIEAMVARQAAARASDADRKALRAIEADMRRAVKEADDLAFSQLQRRAAPGNPAHRRQRHRRAAFSRRCARIWCACNIASSCCRAGRNPRSPSIAPSSRRCARATATPPKPRCAGT